MFIATLRHRLSFLWVVTILTAHASAATIAIPPITITNLADDASYVPPPAESSSTSGVTFGPSGPGTFISSGFTASINSSDQVTVRIQAPVGQQFKVLMPANATSLEIGCLARWISGGGSGGAQPSSPSTVTWIALQGPAPARTADLNYITNNGRLIVVENTFTASAAFSFQALEITFTVANNPSGTNTYNPVSSVNTPSFYARARGVGLAVSPAMEFESLPVITQALPPVTITSLAHQYVTGPLNTAQDSVTFSSGPGTYTSSGFAATLEQSNELAVRFEAPAGKAFLVRKWAQATDTKLVFRGTWIGAAGPSSQVVNDTVTWEGLSNLPPTLIVGENSVSDNGGQISVRHEFQVTDSFYFTAIEIRFPILNSTPGTAYNFAPIASTLTPSMGAIASGPTLGNVPVMDIVDLVPESIEIPPVEVQELAHLYLPEQFGPGTDTIYDGVTATGLGMLNGPGFAASIAANDEVVIRYQAPAGFRFRVTSPSSGSLSYRLLTINGSWRTNVNDGVLGSSGGFPPTVSWLGLIGPAPTPTGSGAIAVISGGNEVRLTEQMSVAAPFEFEGVEFRGVVPGLQIANWTRSYLDVGPIFVDPPFLSAVFLLEGVGSNLPDEPLMELVPIAPPACPGDANGDNSVNGADLSVMLGQFGQNVSPGTGADLNGDGVVNGADLSVLLGQFGQVCS